MAHITINGCEIPWSFVALVKKKCKGDWETIMDCFYRVRKLTRAEDMIKYVMAGFKYPGAGTIPWNFTPSATRQNKGGMEIIERWWQGCAGYNYREIDIDSIVRLKDINEILKKRSFKDG